MSEGLAGTAALIPARTGDLAAIAPLMAIFNHEEGIAWRPEAMLPALERLLRDPSLGVVLLARAGHGGALRGYAIATFGYDVEFAGPDAFVTELFVAPEARRTGLGRRLLEGMLAALAERGVRAAHLVVRPENTPARGLYDELGFREIPRLLMTRPIGPPVARSATEPPALRFEPFAGEIDELVRLLTGSTWPFHGTPHPSPEEIRKSFAEGVYTGEHVRTTWIVEADGGERIGFLRAFDLDDPTAVFDLRIAEPWRRRGIGSAALRWLVERLFSERSTLLRIEAHVRADNRGMSRTLERCGWIREAFRRDAWPSRDGTLHDAVGYAITRSDWRNRAGNL